LIVQTLLLLALSFNIYFEITNPQKINAWQDAILSENLDGLTSDEAFVRLSKHGFRIVDKNILPTGETKMIIAPPYQVGIIGLLRVKVPFDYIVRTNSLGMISSYGVQK